MFKADESESLTENNVTCLPPCCDLVIVKRISSPVSDGILNWKHWPVNFGCVCQNQQKHVSDLCLLFNWGN